MGTVSRIRKFCFFLRACFATLNSEVEIITPFSDTVQEPEEEWSVHGPGWEMGNWGHRIVIWNLKPRKAVPMGVLFLSCLSLLGLSFKVSHSYQDFPALPVSPLRKCMQG